MRRVARSGLAVAMLGFGAMAVALVYGFTQGGGWDEVRALTRYPWFNVSLVDVYVGFALFSAWVAHRESAWWTAALWITAIMLLGNLVACAYVLFAAATARGDGHRFWHGLAPASLG